MHTFEAFINSSAKHSAMVLIFLNAASRAPVQRSQIAWFTRLNGATSTACLRTVPARPIRVESSRGPELMIASTKIWTGFSPVSKWMISKACLTMRTVINFLPLLRPCIIMELVNRSTIGHCEMKSYKS